MKKEQRRLVLNGTDDAYAKREAVQDMGSDQVSTTDAVTPEKSAPKRLGLKTKPAVQTEKPTAIPTADAEPSLNTGHAIQVNYRLNLGLKLSARLQRLADAHDQPIDLILRGIRIKTSKRFRVLVLQTTKPPIPVLEAGGISIRYACVFSGELAQNLNAWFDPFVLGVAKNACKPILIGLFQDEARALCDLAE